METHSADRCIMYGQCMNNTDQTGLLNCAYNGSAVLVPPGSEELSILKSLCPMLYEPGEDTYACCDIKQLKTLRDSTKVAQQMLGGCPSCYYNFMSVFCHLTCDRNQSRFMRATHAIEVPNRPGEFALDATEFFIDTYPFNEFFNSCANVQFSASQSKALDALCGQPAETCTPQALLTYLGGLSHSPFEITFTHVNQTVPDYIRDLGMIGFNTTMYRCDESPNSIGFTNRSCSCQDCQLPTVCPAIPPIPKSSPFLIFSFDGVTFIVLVSYVVLLFGSLFLFLACNRATEYTDIEVSKCPVTNYVWTVHALTMCSVYLVALLSPSAFCKCHLVS